MNEETEDLLAEAARDYGTPEEREQRESDARMNIVFARAHASESSQADGRRP